MLLSLPIIEFRVLARNIIESHTLSVSAPFRLPTHPLRGTRPPLSGYQYATSWHYLVARGRGSGDRGGFGGGGGMGQRFKDVRVEAGRRWEARVDA